MRKFLFIQVFLCSIFFIYVNSNKVQAQIPKGEKLVRIGVNYQRSKREYKEGYYPNNRILIYTNLNNNVLPAYGKFIYRNWYLGAYGILGLGKSTIETEYTGGAKQMMLDVKSYRFGGGLVLRKHFPVCKAFSLLAATSLKYFFEKDYKVEEGPNTTSGNGKDNYLISDIQVGVLYMLNSKLGIDFMYSPAAFAYSRSLGANNVWYSNVAFGLGREIDYFSLGLNIVL